MHCYTFNDFVEILDWLENKEDDMKVVIEVPHWELGNVDNIHTFIERVHGMGHQFGTFSIYDCVLADKLEKLGVDYVYSDYNCNLTNTPEDYFYGASSSWLNKPIFLMGASAIGGMVIGSAIAISANSNFGEDDESDDDTEGESLESTRGNKNNKLQSITKGFDLIYNMFTAY